MSVSLVTDTTQYLPRRFIDAYAIQAVSLYVHRGDEAVRESEITDYDAYYASLAGSGALPTTSQPSIGDFLAVYEPLLGRGDEIISIHLAGGISGTYRAALQARDTLAPEVAARVHVVDSGMAAGALGLQLMAAGVALKRGGSVNEALAAAVELRERIKLYFAVDTLEYLQRGGRIGAASAFLGTALKIKPILQINDEILPVEKVRTSKKALERLVRLLEECHQTGLESWVIQHIQAPEQAQILIERGREIFGAEPIYVGEIGPVIGTHIGPGLIGAGAVPSSLVERIPEA
jgi:DegV family protein with EDD domain